MTFWWEEAYSERYGLDGRVWRSIDNKRGVPSHHDGVPFTRVSPEFDTEAQLVGWLRAQSDELAKARLGCYDHIQYEIQRDDEIWDRLDAELDLERDQAENPTDEDLWLLRGERGSGSDFDRD